MSDIRRPLTAVVALIILACALFWLSFFVGLPLQENSSSTTDKFSDQFILQPLANKTLDHSIQKECTLTIYASANGTFETNLLYKGELAGSPITSSSVRNTYKLYDIGDYTLRFRNTNPTDIEVTYNIEFVETKYTTEWIFLWLRWPIFVFGIFFMLITLPVYAFPQIKRHVRIKSLETGIVAALVVILLFNYQIMGLILGTSAPWVIAEGTSMEPNLHGGDLIIIEGASAQNLKVGDIALYNKFAINTTTGTSRTLPAAVLHRIIQVFQINDQAYFATKGDNNPTPDESLVPSDGIIGKAVYVIPNLGFAVAFLTNTETKIILLTMLALAYFVAPELIAEIKKRKTKTNCKKN
jgi:signal peptidase